MEEKIDSPPSLSQIFHEARPSWRTRGYNHNIDLYERYLKRKKQKNFNLLEVGGATRYIDYCAWQDYFSSAKIFCARCGGEESYNEQSRDLDQSRTNYFKLEDIGDWIADRKFEIVIDSSGQDFASIHNRFKKIFSHLEVGGLYFIERVNPSRIMEYALEMGHKAIDAQDFSQMTDEKRSFLPSDYGMVVFERKNDIERALENVLEK